MPAPTPFEQEMLELINRARANPAGEFDALIADAATRTGVTAEITYVDGGFSQVMPTPAESS